MAAHFPIKPPAASLVLVLALSILFSLLPPTLQLQEANGDLGRQSTLQPALDPRPFQCEASVYLFNAISAQNDLLPETDKLSELPLGTKTVWPAGNISLPGSGPSSFGWVETAGEGLFHSVVNQKACAFLSARSASGAAFDQGPRQQAFFFAFLLGGEGDTIMAADVDYLPYRSMHRLCYTAPAVGHFLLDLRLGFVNAWHTGTCVDPSNGAGFAGYQSVLSTWVRVTGQGPPGWQYDLKAYRASLPVCTSDMLATTGNGGFWVGLNWYPTACRLSRLEPPDMLQCMNGKRILITGDSQSRILFGLMQIFLSYGSRADFLQGIASFPNPNGDLLKLLNLSVQLGSNGSSPIPLLDPATGQAVTAQFPFLNGTTTYYGGVYEGFSVRQVSGEFVDADGLAQSIDFNLTYSSFFTVMDPLFSDWKLSGAITNGTKVTDGGLPFDIVLMANQIHDSSNFDTTMDYLHVVANRFLPTLQQYISNPNALFMLGGLSAFEGRKQGILYRDNNLRLTSFETATADFLSSKGYQYFFKVSPLTAPRPDLASDATHYTWPVSLVLLDLWLGSLCPNEGRAD